MTSPDLTSPPDARDRLQASKEALKLIYYVVVGLAIADALDQAFAPNGLFLGKQAFSPDRLPTLLLLVAFLTTIFRFVHGASIHLDIIQTGRFKALADFFGFFLQAAVFYLMALSLVNRATFCWLFIIMLTLDTLWLILLKFLRYVDLGGTEIQWIISDVIIIAIIGLVLCSDPPLARAVSAWIVATTGIMAFVLDYWMNRDFYFPVRGGAR